MIASSFCGGFLYTTFRASSPLQRAFASSPNGIPLPGNPEFEQVNRRIGQTKLSITLDDFQQLKISPDRKLAIKSNLQQLERLMQENQTSSEFDKIVFKILKEICNDSDSPSL